GGTDQHDDLAAERGIASNRELRTQARFRGGQSEHAAAAGDDHKIRCYFDAARNGPRPGGMLRLQAASVPRQHDRSPSSRFPEGARIYAVAARATNLDDPSHRIRVVGIMNTERFFLEMAVKTNSREIHPMCRLSDVFTPSELRTLSKGKRDILQEYGRLIVLTNPAIRNLIKKDRTIQRKLKRLLDPELRRLKKI